MPPAPIADTSMMSHILFGQRGIGGVNDRSNDKPGVAVLDANEAEAVVEALSHYAGKDDVSVSNRIPDRRPGALRGLEQMVSNGDVALVGGASKVLKGYAATVGLALKLQDTCPATLGVIAGRAQA